MSLFEKKRFQFLFLFYFKTKFANLSASPFFWICRGHAFKWSKNEQNPLRTEKKVSCSRVTMSRVNCVIFRTLERFNFVASALFKVIFKFDFEIRHQVLQVGNKWKKSERLRWKFLRFGVEWPIYIWASANAIRKLPFILLNSGLSALSRHHILQFAIWKSKSEWTGR